MDPTLEETKEIPKVSGPGTPDRAYTGYGDPTQKYVGVLPGDRPRVPDTRNDGVHVSYKVLAIVAALLSALAAVASVVALMYTSEPTQGPQGPPGLDGRDGIDGEQGDQGIPGPPGLDGADAPIPETTTTTFALNNGQICVVRGQPVPCDEVR